MLNRTLAIINSSWREATSNYNIISQNFLLLRTINVIVFPLRIVVVYLVSENNFWVNEKLIHDVRLLKCVTWNNGQNELCPT